MYARSLLLALCSACLFSLSTPPHANAQSMQSSYSIIINGELTFDAAEYITTGTGTPIQYNVVFSTVPLRNAVVEVWDVQWPANRKLDTNPAVIRTDDYGQFQVEVLADEPAGIEPYIIFYATDDISIDVKKPSFGETYAAGTTRVGDDLLAGTYSMQWNIPSTFPGDELEAFFIFDLLANEGYRQLPTLLGSWSQTTPLTVRWPQGCATLADNSCYTGDFFHEVQIHEADGWDRDLLLHEYAHFVLGHGLNNNDIVFYACAENGFSHDYDVHLPESCAWSEGWADFFQAAIQNSPDYHNAVYQRGLTPLPFGYRARNIETPISADLPTVNASHPDLRTSKMAVTATWWDIYDAASSSEPWDVLQDGMTSPNGGIWTVLSNETHASGFYNFWDGWKRQVELHLCETSAIMHENGIDLGNREPYTIEVFSADPTKGTVFISHPPAPNCLNGKYYGHDPDWAPGIIFTAVPASGYSFEYWNIIVAATPTPYTLTNTPSLANLIGNVIKNKTAINLTETYAFNLYDYPIRFTAYFNQWYVYLPTLRK